MSNHVHAFQALGTDTYCVVAAANARLLPQLREALAPLRASSVLVSLAMNWAEAGQELTYRGHRFRRDLEIARVEITCRERDVEAILAAISRVLEWGAELPGDTATRPGASTRALASMIPGTT